jgi:hypothetical protein
MFLVGDKPRVHANQIRKWLLDHPSVALLVAATYFEWTLCRVLNNEDIFKLKQAGLSDDLLIAKIKSSPAGYHLDPDDLIALKKANLSDAVIAAMLDAQTRNK